MFALWKHAHKGKAAVKVFSFSYSIHVDAVCVGPGMLEVLLQPLSQTSWDLMETYELLDPQHLGVVAGRAWVKSLNDGWYVSEYTGIHQSCMEQKAETIYSWSCDKFDYISPVYLCTIKK